MEILLLRELFRVLREVSQLAELRDVKANFVMQLKPLYCTAWWPQKEANFKAFVQSPLCKNLGCHESKILADLWKKRSKALFKRSSQKPKWSWFSTSKKKRLGSIKWNKCFVTRFSACFPCKIIVSKILSQRNLAPIFSLPIFWAKSEISVSTLFQHMVNNWKVHLYIVRLSTAGKNSRSKF